MHNKKYLRPNNPPMPIALYDSEQLYAIEQSWFAQGYDSFALMQQAAWQMTQKIIQLENQNYQHLVISSITSESFYTHSERKPSASIWVGRGNNGGDGWLISHYLQQAGWRVQVTTVGIDNINNNKQEIADALKAQQIAIDANVPFQCFEEQYDESSKSIDHLQADVYIDALFGIGLDRAPTGIYKQAIECFNKAADSGNNYNKDLVIAVDIPSGLQASTGQVFDRLAIEADITLCLIARKFGLHTKDGMDYAGIVIDMPLIPFMAVTPVATLLNTAQRLPARRQNSYKGSYGHVLVIGGNQINGSQGMGGAAILASASAMATGAGKITVACHKAFHGALLTSLPDAMTIDLHDRDGVKELIKETTIVAIGMGMGRDNTAKALFVSYVRAVIKQGYSIVIDADGLYHLASLHAEGHKLVDELKNYSKTQEVYCTPHSGEAARLLNKQITAVEDDRLAAIKQCATTYGGNWVLKGVGSLVLEQSSKDQAQIYVCAVGNAGMATAGMGDVLSGLIAGLLVQQDLVDEQHSLCQAVLVHGLAGDLLVKQLSYNNHDLSFAMDEILSVGQRGLQAQDMPAAIRQVIQLITV